MSNTIRPPSISGPAPPVDGSELVFALVAPVGTHFELFVNPLKKYLGDSPFNYEVKEHRISDLLVMLTPHEALPGEESREFERLDRGMKRGNQLRLNAKTGDFLSLAVAMKIREHRDLNVENGTLKRCVHVIRSLKHPDEVRALRRIYGNGLFLIALNVDEGERRRHLENGLGCSKEEVDRLLKRDDEEKNPRWFDEQGINYGQRTRDTFHLADVFLPLQNQKEMKRFVGLVFGYPFDTPTQDEHAMFMAFSSALRSADLSRQVGAVVVSDKGDLIATGANDVPRPQGGLYWPGKDDQRDHQFKSGDKHGVDSNELQRNLIVEEILKRLEPEGIDPDEWLKRGKRKLKGSQVMDITEYGRAVHAEMEALMCCARSGTSPRSGTLYSTTFPCHNCAKHIVAAGVERVVYVEPYPKSQTGKLFSDSIRLHGQETAVGDKRVYFEPFQGVGPRRFFDLFSMALSSGTRIKRKKGPTKKEWVPDVRVPMVPNSYLEQEAVAIEELIAMTAKEETEDAENLQK